MQKLEQFLELGRQSKKDIVLLVLSGLSLVAQHVSLRFLSPLTRRGWRSYCAAFPSCWRLSSAWSPRLTSRPTCWFPWH